MSGEERETKRERKNELNAQSKDTRRENVETREEN